MTVRNYILNKIVQYPHIAVRIKFYPERLFGNINVVIYLLIFKYESARYKDYNLLMLLSLLSGALVILCSIIAQTINEQIDPRIRAEQAVREAEVQP